MKEEMGSFGAKETSVQIHMHYSWQQTAYLAQRPILTRSYGTQVPTLCD